MHRSVIRARQFAKACQDSTTDALRLTVEPPTVVTTVDVTVEPGKVIVVLPPGAHWQEPGAPGGIPGTGLEP